MTTAHESRQETLARFREQATKLFADKPEYHSALFAVAQYWNDSANDEVHSRVLVSTRAVPVWPHVCSYDDEEVWDDALEELVPAGNAIAGDACNYCHEDRWWLDMRVHAWEPYCHEHANQSQSMAEAYLPYAIARRRDAGEAELEIVGRLQRAEAESIAGEPTLDPWPDPRARTLFDQVCASPDDDGPRAVLGDYLLETRANAVDPRGELIALSLAPRLDDEARARRDALLATHVREWIAPLGSVIPAGCAQFERGFLARAHVYARASPPDRVRAAATWGTLETLRFLPDSLELIDPAMVALRDVAPVGTEGRDVIAGADRPWRIETLQLVTSLGPLCHTTKLPRLRHLVIGLDHLDELVEYGVHSPWWSQLERITLTTREDVSPRGWHEHHRKLEPLPWLALASTGENGEPAGWQLAFGPDRAVEISVPGWHPHATPAQLVELVLDLPGDVSITLVSSPYRVLTAADAEVVKRRAEREVSVR
jgi:uncharacterized protein (TIGR02996 family)